LVRSLLPGRVSHFAGLGSCLPPLVDPALGPWPARLALATRYDHPARLGLLGLAADKDADSIMEKLADLHPRNNTFPAEVLLELAAEAIEESGTSPADPLQYEGMRDRHLPEYHFRGKVPAAQEPLCLHGRRHDPGRVYPDLLDEAHGWGIDDMWTYAFYALVLYGRMAAERTGRFAR
jgi:hypothetical protein